MKVNKASKLSRKNDKIVEKIKELQAKVNAACIDEDNDFLDRTNQQFSEAISLLKSLSLRLLVIEFEES